MNRRELLRLTACGGAYLALRGVGPAEGAGPEGEVAYSTVDELKSRLDSGQATAETLSRQYLQRIADIDQTGPALKSVIELNPDALAIAKALDEERNAKGSRGPLHGVPVLVKDNLDTHDRMTTTAGSLALAGSVPARDSFVVQKLREAGAVLLGKTNLSEWANFRSSHSTSGWSGRGGLTKNPYALDRNPSGSSSGSAVAVAAGLCAVAIGTETDGSIVSPSTVCGIVGLKPTLGLVSRAGIVPIAHSQDTAGPMGRTVRDVAVLLGAVAGPDPRDAATEKGEGKAERDYTKFLDAGGMKGARIGVVRRFFRPGTKAGAVMESALNVMRDLGATLVDPADFPTAEKFGGEEFQVLLYEFKADLNAYLAGLGDGARVRSLADVIAFNDAHADKELPYFGQDIMLQAQGMGPLTEKKYLDALETCRRLSRAEGIDAVMDASKLDVLVAPSGGPAGKTDLIYGDRDVGGSSSPAAVAGYPNISVPAGEVMGLPLGISFFGRAFSEPTLLRLAYAFEQATKARRAPQFLPTVG